MATLPDEIRGIRAGIAHSVRDHWFMYLIEGIALLVLGILAAAMPGIASLAATVLFGWILLFSGVVILIAAVRARDAPGFWWSLFSGIIGIVAGLLLLIRPMRGVLTLTIVLIAFLLAQGVISMLYAVEHRRQQSGRWGWILASGIVDLVLGILLLMGFPGTAVWALGLLLAIKLMFGGWSLIMMALHARPRTPVQVAR
jgi:uncharacterized membrane protein HdeD (DUF308 family)